MDVSLSDCCEQVQVGESVNYFTGFLCQWRIHIEVQGISQSVRSNSETASVIIGSFGRQWRPMYCKLGHRAEKIVISDQRFRKVAHCEYDVDMSGSDRKSVV